LDTALHIDHHMIMSLSRPSCLSYVLSPYFQQE